MSYNHKEYLKELRNKTECDVRNHLYKAFSTNPSVVERAVKGDKKAKIFLTSCVMVAMLGTINPDYVNKILDEELSKF